MPNYRHVIYHIGTLMYLLGFAQIVPLIASILLNENILFILAIGSMVTICILLAYILHRYGIYGEIDLGDAFIVMFFAFLIPSFTCAFPIMVQGVDFIDALFEGVSAITTTGLSALPEYALTPGVHFLRAYYQWLGGLSIALLVVSFLLSPGSSAYNIYMAHLGKFKISPLSISTVRIILKIYLLFTFFFIILYLLSGLPIYDAVINSLTTISTGGFSTISTFKGVLMITGTILMFMSAQPLAIYYFLYKKKINKIIKDPQLLLFTSIILISFIIFSISVNGLKIASVFQIVSALSTTGYSALDNSSLPDGSKLLLSILMIIGAGFGSTGGGIKQLRLYIILKTIMNTLSKQLFSHRTVSPIKIGDNVIENREVIYVFTLLSLYIITLLLSTLIFTLYGYRLVDSLFESSSALATTGLSVGLSSTKLELVPKIVLIIDMFLGRLEIVPVLIVFLKIFRRR